MKRIMLMCVLFVFFLTACGDGGAEVGYWEPDDGIRDAVIYLHTEDEEEVTVSCDLARISDDDSQGWECWRTDGDSEEYEEDPRGWYSEDEVIKVVKNEY